MKTFPCVWWCATPDWRSAKAARSATALGFYLIVVALIPVAVGPDLKLLQLIAPGVLWVALLLSALLSLGGVFDPDFDDGSLEIMAISTLPLELTVVAKSLAHWLTTGVPLVAMTPLLGLLLNLDHLRLPRSSSGQCWLARLLLVFSVPSLRL